MSTELYRKYRPATLERVIGNESTVSALVKMLERGKVPHAILFHGPSGCAKTTLARIVATEVGTASLDLVEINCAGSRGIDTVREVGERMRLAPTGGKKRTWILDEVQMLTREAQNAALKMVEEPPDHVHIILCTTEPGKLIAPLRSRCTELPVRPLNIEETTKLVSRVCKREEMDVPPKQVIDALFDYANGAPRRILVGLEKTRDLTDKDKVDALSVLADEENESIELCKALQQSKPWAKVTAVLKALKAPPEDTRRAVLGYARKVLLGSDGKGGHRSYMIICAFEKNFYDSGDAGLIRACYEVVFGE